MRRLRIISAALLAAVPALSEAQPPRQPPVTITAFRHFTVADGMPGPFVIALAQDSRGVLWVGTTDGLCRWDGARFYTPPEQYRYLQTPLVRCLHMANDSLLLIGTMSGICVYNIYTARYENERITVPRLKAGIGREAWVLGVGGGRLLVSAGQELFLLDGSLRLLRKRRLSALADDPHVFLPHPGFFPLADSSITGYARLPGPMQALHIPTLRDTVWPPGFEAIEAIPYRGFYSATTLRRSGRALFSGWGTGLIEYTPGAGARAHLLNPVNTGSGGYAYAIAPDPADAGIIWAGTGADLFSVNLYTRAIQQYHLATALQSDRQTPNDIKAVLFDRSGGLWIGTATGLVALSPQRTAFKTITIKGLDQPLGVNEPLLLDRRGRLWAGCWGAWIQQLDTAGTLVRTHRIRNRAPFNFTRRLLTEDDTIWTATEGGFFYYNEAAGRFLPPAFVPDSLRWENAWTALRDHRKCWWIYYRGRGLFCYDAAHGVKCMYPAIGHDTAAPGYIPTNGVSIIAEDRAGGIWTGHNYERGMIARLDPRIGRFAQIIPVIKGEPQPMIPVNDMAADSAGGVWIATEWFGILHYNAARNSWTQYDQSRGLSSVLTKHLFIDWTGRVWTHTANTLAVLERGAAGFRTLTAADGVPFGNIQNIGIPDPFTPWRMMINSPTAFAWIDLRSVVPPHRTPAVFIEGVAAEGHVVAFAGAGHFTHKSSHFTFRFVAPDVGGSGDVQYAYKIEGLDESWKDIGAERSVSLANVPPGKYAFLVRARVGSGPWSPSARYVFFITPPFWNRWWFYALCALIVAAAVYAIYRYQLSKAIALLHVRNRISRDLHDEVGSTLSAISLMNELAASKGGDDATARKKLGERIRKVQDAMSEIVWMINPANDHLDNLVLRFGEAAAELLEPAGIRYTFTADGLQGLRLPMDARRELFLIFKEALNNIVKHSGATEVIIGISSLHGTVSMKVTDNGRGFDKARAKSGAGLGNMAARAAALKGRATVSSILGKGTLVSVGLPAVARRGKI